MNANEKTLLLQLILEDIRGNWAYENKPRIPKALELAEELDLQNHVRSIKHYDFYDGRYFRMDVEHGGYIGMDSLHGLDKNVLTKSKEFIAECEDYLTYPHHRLENWNDRFSIKD